MADDKSANAIADGLNALAQAGEGFLRALGRTLAPLSGVATFAWLLSFVSVRDNPQLSNWVSTGLAVGLFFSIIVYMYELAILTGRRRSPNKTKPKSQQQIQTPGNQVLPPTNPVNAIPDLIEQTRAAKPVHRT